MELPRSIGIARRPLGDAKFRQEISPTQKTTEIWCSFNIRLSGFLLHWWARNRVMGTVDAAVAWIRTKDHAGSHAI